MTLHNPRPLHASLCGCTSWQACTHAMMCSHTRGPPAIITMRPSRLARLLAGSKPWQVATSR